MALFSARSFFASAACAIEALKLVFTTANDMPSCSKPQLSLTKKQIRCQIMLSYCITSFFSVNELREYWFTCFFNIKNGNN